MTGRDEILGTANRLWWIFLLRGIAGLLLGVSVLIGAEHRKGLATFIAVYWLVGAVLTIRWVLANRMATREPAGARGGDRRYHRGRSRADRGRAGSSRAREVHVPQLLAGDRARRGRALAAALGRAARRGGLTEHDGVDGDGREEQSQVQDRELEQP